MPGLKFQTVPKAVSPNQMRQLIFTVSDGRLRVEGLSEGQQYDPTQPPKFDFWLPDENLGELWTAVSVIRQQLWGPPRRNGVGGDGFLHPMGTIRTQCVIRVPTTSVILPRDRELTLHLEGPGDWPPPKLAHLDDNSRLRWQNDNLPWVRLAAGRTDDERSRLYLFPNEVEALYLACLATVAQGTAQGRVTDPMVQLMMLTP